MFAYMGAAFLLKWLWASSSVVETMKCWGMSGPLVISLSVYMTLVFAVLQVVRSSCTAVFACFVQVGEFVGIYFCVFAAGETLDWTSTRCLYFTYSEAMIPINCRVNFYFEFIENCGPLATDD